MKDFLNGKAVRITSGRDAAALPAFLRRCDEYGLRWSDGSKATMWPPVSAPFPRDTRPRQHDYIIRCDASGDLFVAYQPPKAGYKHLREIRPLGHTFGQFMRKDFWLHVRRDEMGEFLDLCAKNKLLWVGGMPPRAGMKGRKPPKEGLTFACIDIDASPRICLVGPRYHGKRKEIVDFRHIPRNYDFPRSSTLDAAREARRAEKHGRKPDKSVALAEIRVPVKMNVDFGKPYATAEGAPPHSNIAPASSSILITANEGENATTARLGRQGARDIQRAKAYCDPGDQFDFATGAIVAIARLLGEGAWASAANDVEQMFRRERRKRLETDTRRVCDLSPDELKEVVREIARSARERSRSTQ